MPSRMSMSRPRLRDLESQPRMRDLESQPWMRDLESQPRVRDLMPRPRVRDLMPLLALTALLGACDDAPVVLDARSPARGPGLLAGVSEPWNQLPLRGGDDPLPAARDVPPPTLPEPPDCDAGCRAHCEAAGLDNPVNAGLCPSLWGVGLATRPIEDAEACRRLFADTLGRFPDLSEIETTCLGRPWSEVVADLLASPDFIRVQQRRWADRLLYNNEALSPVRIYDADELVAKLYRGLVPYDQFAAVLSAHPVLTRRYATASDRAEAFFRLFVGRPPFEHERADLSRLYMLWVNDYYDHPSFGRVPDAFIEFRCTDDEGLRDPDRAGECASVLWGYRELILEPDARALAREDGRLWSGLLTSAEWARLQEPGRVVAALPAFWEKAVDDVLDQYLGYRLTTLVPQIRENLIDYLLEHGADLRSVHFAVLTSAAYLQSALDAPAPSADAPPAFRTTWGPLKQAEVETWLDTVSLASSVDIGACDHRLPDPWRVLNQHTIGGYALVEASGWPLRDDGRAIDETYLDLARSLGGCPENLAGGRFKTVSILTTATQEAFVTSLCNPGLLENRDDRATPEAPVEALLPPGMPPQRELDPSTAVAVLDHQLGRFFARAPTLDERASIESASAECAPKPCTVEAFARPLCFALLSSAEMLFY